MPPALSSPGDDEASVRKARKGGGDEVGRECTMLHVPMHVALITEKLRGQTLEDDHLKVPREGALQIEGKNVWLSVDGGDSRDQEGNTTSREGRGSSTTGVGSSFTSFLPPLNDNDRLVLGSAGAATVLTNPHTAAAVFSRGSPPGCFPLQQMLAHSRFPVKPVARVRSNLNEHGRGCALDYMRTYDTPPKKKHCRSLSVPADTPHQGPNGGVGGVASTSPQVEGAKMWRPVPIPAQADSGRTLPSPFLQSSHHSFSAFSTGVRGDCSSSARFSRDYRIKGVYDGLILARTGMASAATTSTFLPMAPPSPVSVDSGRDTTSDRHTTPPQSPVPRPSSATSLRSVHTAFSAASCWSSSGGSGAYSYHRPFNRSEVLQSRSLSYEEQMSPVGLQPSASGSSPCVASGSGVGLGYPGGFGGSAYSLPLSPCRNKIPRCHSQPCVLHDRRCGKKRRRDDRPTLDFHKMTETAYPGKTASSVTPAQDIQKVRWRADVDYMCVGGLMPIASSPRDTDLPATPQAADQAVLLAVSQLDLLCTPPASDISSGIDICEPVKLIGDEEQEELDDQDVGSICGCHRDSGNCREADNSSLFPLTDLDLSEIENH